MKKAFKEFIINILKEALEPLFSDLYKSLAGIRLSETAHFEEMQNTLETLEKNKPKTIVKHLVVVKKTLEKVPIETIKEVIVDRPVEVLKIQEVDKTTSTETKIIFYNNCDKIEQAVAKFCIDNIDDPDPEKFRLIARKVSESTAMLYQYGITNEERKEAIKNALQCWAKGEPTPENFTTFYKK